MTPRDLAKTIAAEYSKLQQVEAVVLAGSQTTDQSDGRSDLDLYVYLPAELPLEERKRIAEMFCAKPEVGNTFFEPGDEWIDQKTGIGADVMFRDKLWIETQLNRVLKDFQASMGYSTCFWHNVLTSEILFDRSGWYKTLQTFAKQPYPEPLRKAIIEKNFPILRSTQSSYLHQLTRAIQRDDSVSMNHRITALLASYFDVLFAINRVPHPGEKRLISIAQARCKTVPARFPKMIDSLIGSEPSEKVKYANALIDDLEKIL